MSPVPGSGERPELSHRFEMAQGILSGLAAQAVAQEERLEDLTGERVGRGELGGWNAATVPRSL